MTTQLSQDQSVLGLLLFLLCLPPSDVRRGCGPHCGCQPAGRVSVMGSGEGAVVGLSLTYLEMKGAGIPTRNGEEEAEGRAALVKWEW